MLRMTAGDEIRSEARAPAALQTAGGRSGCQPYERQSQKQPARRQCYMKQQNQQPSTNDKANSGSEQKVPRRPKSGLCRDDDGKQKQNRERRRGPPYKTHARSGRMWL